MTEPVAKKSRVENGSCGDPAAVDPEQQEESIAENVDEDILVTSSDIVLSLKEEDVGIAEFVGNHAGFRALLKARWEDFLVHEVAEDGSLVQLTSFESPKLAEKDSVEETKFSLTEEIKTELDKVFSKQVASTYLEAPSDKEARTELHKSIKFFYPTLCSETKVDKNNDRKIHIRPNTDLSHREKQRGNNSTRGGRFCHFVLYKEGRETSAVLSLLSRMLNLTANQISVCGNKDKRAITSQRASIKNIDADRLNSLNNQLHGIRVGNFIYAHDTLRLGDLTGNRFTLVLREVVGTDKDIEAGINSLQTNGFINYFGMQRFGNSEISSYLVGIEILKSNWSTAIDLILRPSKADLPNIREWKEKYSTGSDIDECLRGIPHSIEKTLLLGIQQHNGKTENALSKLSRNLRQLYLHSFQSLIWNKVSSRRIKELGKQPIVGDLVISGIKSSKGRSGNTPTVKILSESDLSCYTLKDVVMPLPGADVIYPQNQVKDWYFEILHDYGLEENCFKHRNRDYFLNGSYRPLLVVAQNVTSNIQYYSDPLKPLVLSDREKMEGKQLDNITHQKEAGPFKAVVLEMTLPKSAYATMAVREASKNVTTTK